MNMARDSIVVAFDVTNLPGGQRQEMGLTWRDLGLWPPEPNIEFSLGYRYWVARHDERGMSALLEMFRLMREACSHQRFSAKARREYVQEWEDKLAETYLTDEGGAAVHDFARILTAHCGRVDYEFDTDGWGLLVLGRPRRKCGFEAF